MKKLFYFACLLLCGLLVGCNDDKNDDPEPIGDPIGISCFIWTNRTEHTITLTVNGKFTAELKSLESITRWDNGLAYCPSITDYARKGIRVAFNDGTYGGIFPSNPVSEFDLTREENYQIQEYDGDNRSALKTWNYIFYSGDYEAAVARGPMTEE